MKKLKINWLLWVQGLLFVGAAVLVFKAVMNIEGILNSIGTFFSVISPIIMAAVIAYMLSRPCKWVEKWIKRANHDFVVKRARGLAILTVYLVMIGIVYTVFRLLFPLLIANINDFVNFAPNLIADIEYFVRGLDLSFLEETLDIQTVITEFFDDFDIQNVIGPVTQGLGVITNVAISTAFWLFDFFLALIISIYMLLYKDVIFETFGRILNLMMKSDNSRTLKYYAKQADDLFYKFIGAQFLDSCIMAAMSIVLLMLLNVRFGVFLGIFLGVANMIPKFGSIIASVVVIALTFLTGDVRQGLWTAVLLTAVQQFDGNVIGPMIMGDALKINPVLVFFSLLVGAQFGIVGMFLSIPIMALIKIITMNIIEAKENSIQHSEKIADRILNPQISKTWQERYREKKTTKKPEESEKK